MSTRSSKIAAQAAPTRRSPGRPRKASSEAEAAAGPALSAEAIMDAAFKLCREIPLADLSIVQLAKALDVAPGTVHYYIDGRDALLSGVIARYFEVLLPCFQTAQGHSWESRVAAVARALYERQVEYRGITAYFIAHNRFSLIQPDAPGAETNGVRFLEAMLKLFREKPFSVACAVVNAQTLARFIGSSAHSASGRQLPGQHRRFLRQQLAGVDPAVFPAVHEALDDFLRLGPDEAFEGGLAILLRGFLDDTQ